ncbi:MAG: hypothetical protein WKF91_18480 [Segetibacter sp.]
MICLSYLYEPVAGNKNYYIVIGEKYQVDPLIFVGIHVIATPLFAVAVWWIIFNRKRKKSILISSLVAIFIFNAANIYLIITGKTFLSGFILL